MSSYAVLVRDALSSRVRAMGAFANFKFSSNTRLQIQPENIPFLGVYLIEEIGLPIEQGNVGQVVFRTSARYGFSVIVQNNDAVAAETALDTAQLAISTLFQDPTLYNWDGTSGPAKVQAFTRAVASHHFGLIGAENEIPIAELRYELTADLGEITYDPVITDNFELLHIETSFPLGGTDEEIAVVQQVKATWNIQQGYYLNDGARLRGIGALRVNATVV
jgi:hypothetical protein